ncbi:uncharacterized protein B0J16DRAFT_331768 [Fusarium flagelliforme]|uniref:uncharacterized protein n=1 Tax=Fusarium flagelliforme TaxID=2675880 RepID=UPI001E8D02E5|nr:uncharacterized protein B0J16DRAFT_331768 [Fusarium flagelliforme]KAH7191787.1 hypothetical protein B0J16DRAFT_331768 [Fusarium flagelliforme]
MAEALGAVGVAASFIQLTDVSIRTCLYLYTFFSSLHNAQQEFEGHVTVLKNIHNAVQLIRQATANQVLLPTEETTLKEHLNSIQHELSSLQKVTAGKNPAKLSVRLKWVMKSAKTERSLQELARRETNIILLLLTITMRNSAESCEHQKANQKMLKTLLSRAEQQSQQELPTKSEISARFERLSIQMDSNVRLYKESLDEGFSKLTRDRDVTIPEDRMEHVLRRVLDSYILPRVEETFSKTSELQNAVTLRLFQEAMGQATEQILSQVAGTRRSDGFSELQSGCIPSNHEQAEWRSTERPKIETKFAGSPYASATKDSQINSPSTETPEHRGKLLGNPRPRGRREWSYWTFAPVVGAFRIQYESQLGQNGRFWTIQIDFWPSMKFFLRKCISLRYSNDYAPQGYMALSPSLAVYPIISDDHPMWELIYDDDIEGIKAQLQDRKIGLYDQDQYGVSILSYAVMHGSLQTAQFLFARGADPTKSAVWGKDALYYLIYYTISRIVQYDTDEDLGLFFSIFHAFVASGCDLDGCDINIYRFLDNFVFPDLIFNQQSAEHRVNGQHDNYEQGLMGDRKIGTVELQNENNSAYASDLALEHSPTDECSYLAGIQRVAQFLRYQGLDLRQQEACSEIEMVLTSAQRMTFPVLNACGVTGEYLETSDEGMNPILYRGLWSAFCPESTFATDNLITMISQGANVYNMEWAGEDWINYVDADGVMSPTAYAKLWNIVPIWRYALKRAGYDPDEVFLEDERRRREFRRLHGATSSAVEMEDPPSSALRRRLV